MKYPLILAAIVASSVALAQQPQQYMVGSNQGLQNLPAATPVMPAYAATARRHIPVRNLDLSDGREHIQGSVRGLKVAVYRFHAQAGQVIRITSNKSNRQIDAGVFRPHDGRRFTTGQVLPESGEYELRIVNIRKDAARNKKPRHYNFTFTLEPGGNPGIDTAPQTGPADIYTPAQFVQGDKTHYRYARPQAQMSQNVGTANAAHQHYGGAGYNAQNIPSAAEAGARPIRLNGQ